MGECLDIVISYTESTSTVEAFRKINRVYANRRGSKESYPPRRARAALSSFFACSISS